MKEVYLEQERSGMEGEKRQTVREFLQETGFELPEGYQFPPARCRACRHQGDGGDFSVLDVQASADGLVFALACPKCGSEELEPGESE